MTSNWLRRWADKVESGNSACEVAIGSAKSLTLPLLESLRIRQLAQADLFDSELDAAKELAKNKFTRAAGAVAAVVLERHLKGCGNHEVTVRKAKPTISHAREGGRPVVLLLLALNDSCPVKNAMTPIGYRNPSMALHTVLRRPRGVICATMGNEPEPYSRSG